MRGRGRTAAARVGAAGCKRINRRGDRRGPGGGGAEPFGASACGYDGDAAAGDAGRVCANVADGEAINIRTITHVILFIYFR